MIIALVMKPSESSSESERGFCCLQVLNKVAWVSADIRGQSKVLTAHLHPKN